MQRLPIALVVLVSSLAVLGCGGGEGKPDAGGSDGGEVDGGGTGSDAGLPDAGEFIPTTNAEHEQMLGTLGFTTTLGPRLDPVGVPVPDDYHQLLKRYAVFHPKAELYIGGHTVEGLREHLFDDASQAWARLAFTGKQDAAWAGATMKNGVAGDFDGDGLEELFVAYYVDVSKKLRYIHLDFDGNTVSEGELEASVDASVAGALDTLLQPSMAAGDLDGDGRDEVAVGFSRFYLVDELEHDPVVTTKVHEGQDVNDAFVAMGNLDWDAADELVVTYTTGRTLGRYAVYDGQFAVPTQAGALTLTDPDNRQLVARETTVAIGDVDGDRLGEAVFGGLAEGNAWVVFVLEFQRPGDVPAYDWKRFTWRTPWAVNGIPHPLLTLDYDGDGRQEVFFRNVVARVTSAPTPTVVNAGFGDVVMPRVSAGDLDGDRRDDLVYEWYSVIYVRGLDSLDQWTTKKSWAGTVTPWNSVILAPLNVDGDSPVVRYDGEHELLFSAPHPLAVMASPPYVADIGQNVGATTATFGKTVGQSVERETSLGVKTGFSVGYEADFGFFGGAEFEMSVEMALDFIAGQTSSIEKYHSYTTGPGEDLVVFTTVPFDVYYYEVVSSPNLMDVGRRVSLNVPRDPQTLATTRAFYDAHNGGGPDVGGTVLQHAAGDPWSYPTPTERDRLLAAAEAREPGYRALWNGPMAVGEGGGSETLGISTTEGSSRGASMEFSVEFAFSATSPGGVKAGTSVGFSYGHALTFSTEDTAFFEGSVGNIPAAAYTSDNRYQFGLFVYPESAGGQSFLVMNWWTEP